VTDLNPPDRLAEITERHWKYDVFGTGDGFECGRCRTTWPCDASVAASEAVWLLGELVETRTLADAEGMVCHCGLPMSRNPHAEAGDPAAVLDVGAVWVCIPCTYRALKKAADARYAAEGERDVERARADAAEQINAPWVGQIAELRLERDEAVARADQLQADLDAAQAEFRYVCDAIEYTLNDADYDDDAGEAEVYATVVRRAGAELVVLREHAAQLTPLVEAATALAHACDGGPIPTYLVTRVVDAAHALPAGSVDAPPPADPPEWFPVTDDLLDAPDGAVVDGYERVGNEWCRREPALVEPPTPEPTERCPWTPTGRHLERADRTCQFCVPVPPQEPTDG
jgi:hypothetical protein